MNVVIDHSTYLLLQIHLYTVYILMAIFLIFCVWVFTNKEARFWLARRHSSKIAVAEFDDTGEVVFKAESSIGQGVLKGSGKMEYSVIPRNIAGNKDQIVKVEIEKRFAAAMNKIIEETAEGKNPSEEEVTSLYQQIKLGVEAEYKDMEGTLEIIRQINSFKAFTSGTKTPFFIRYAGKAITVNPLTGVVATNNGKYARVPDLKTFFTNMITPSQLKYIAFKSELIGAKKEGGGFPFMPLVLMILFIVIVLGVIYVLLPMFGIKL